MKDKRNPCPSCGARGFKSRERGCAFCRAEEGEWLDLAPYSLSYEDLVDTAVDHARNVSYQYTDATRHPVRYRSHE